MMMMVMMMMLRMMEIVRIMGMMMRMMMIMRMIVMMIVPNLHHPIKFVFLSMKPWLGDGALHVVDANVRRRRKHIIFF